MREIWVSLRTNAGLGASIAAVLLLFSGCSVIDPTGSQSTLEDELYEIEEGSSVRLGQSGLILSFDEVVGDSRCPADVECVWQGEAEAAFTLHGRNGDAFRLTIPGLVSVPYEENDEVGVGGYTFKLLELSPYPEHRDDGPVPPYRALLRIEGIADGKSRR